MLVYLFLMSMAGVAALSLWSKHSMAVERLRAADARGDFVAEVWLEWPVCRGSTLYRGRYATRARAVDHARRAAQVLDSVLPRTYRAEDWGGKPYREAYDYGVRFGVRPLTTHEREFGVREFLETSMPGHKGHQGEHRCAHPSLREPDSAAAVQLRGYQT